MHERLRGQVAAAARRLAAEGLVVGAAGNVSAREGEALAVTASGARFAGLEPDGVSLVGLDGALLDSGLEPTSELELHLGVYRRFGAGAVVHTHAPVCTALACVIEELPAVHYGMLELGGAVRVAPYETFGTPELAAGVLDALEGRTAALMANHGAISHGPDLETAIERTLLLEWAANVYLRASAIGEPRVLDQAQLEAAAEAFESRGYGKPAG